MRSWKTMAAVTLAGALLVGACSKDDTGTAGASGSSTPVTLSNVIFSVPKPGYDAAEAAWTKTSAGKNVTFESSYGASGDQSRAVESGKQADYVGFSLESDMTRLVKAGKVADDWNAGPTKGIVSSSLVVLVVRKGNPKHIEDWDDIVKPGVGIVSPNPGSSGSARWNLLAGWVNVTQNGGTEAQAKDYITKFFQHAVALPGSGRDATTAFASGTGDVLISYENEAIFARQSGQDFDYVIPPTTLRIDNPGAVTVGSNPKAKAFLDYVISKDGQKLFAQKGFRPVVDGVHVEVPGANDPRDPYPAPRKQLVTIADLGGWSVAGKKFFGTVEKDGADGIITTIQNRSGKGNQ
jgi:sulfate transport system substrate-binding protein